MNASSRPGAFAHMYVDQEQPKSRPMSVVEDERLGPLPLARYTYDDSGESAGIWPAMPRWIKDTFFPQGTQESNPIGHAIAATAGGIGLGRVAGGAIPRGAFGANAFRRELGALDDAPWDDLPFSGGQGIARSELPAPAVRARADGEVFDYGYHDGLPVENPLGLPPTPIYTAPRGASPRVGDALADSRSARTIGRNMDKGLAENGDTVLNWYNTEPLRERFNDLYTDPYNTGLSGDGAFSQFIDAVAATSPQTPVPKNITEASQIYQMMQKGEQIPLDNNLLKSSGRDLSGVAANSKLFQARAMQDGTFDPLNARKVAHFAGNLKGLRGTTIDAHATRGFAMPTKDPRFVENAVRYQDPNSRQYLTYSPRSMLESGEVSMKEALDNPTWWLSRPTRGEYKFIADKYDDLAKRRGLSSEQGQAAAWYGGADKTGVKTEPLTFIQLLEKKLQENASNRSLSTEDVLRQMINAEKPIYQQHNPFGGLLYDPEPNDDNDGRA